MNKINYYGVDLFHKKDPGAKSYFTCIGYITEDEIKEIVSSCCSNARVEKIQKFKFLAEEHEVPLAQGLHVLNYEYSKRKKELFKTKLQNIFRRRKI